MLSTTSRSLRPRISLISKAASAIRTFKATSPRPWLLKCRAYFDCHLFPGNKIGHFHPAVFRIQTPRKIQTDLRRFSVLTRFSIHLSFLTARFFPFFRYKILRNQNFSCCKLFNSNRFHRIQQNLSNSIKIVKKTRF